MAGAVPPRPPLPCNPATAAWSRIFLAGTEHADDRQTNGENIAISGLTGVAALPRQPLVLNRVSKFIVLLAAVQLLGGHWIALQSVAWAGMLADNLRAGSLAAAVEKTFDGDHPCSLCEVVEKGRASEQERPLVQTTVRLDAVIPATVRLLPPDPGDVRHFVCQSASPSRSSAPPTPPPRAA